MQLNDESRFALVQVCKIYDICMTYTYICLITLIYYVYFNMELNVKEDIP